MDRMPGRLVCGKCGGYSPTGSPRCVECLTPFGSPMVPTGRLSSSPRIDLNTRSFFVPVRKSAMWFWVACSVVLPILMSGAYFLAKILFK